MAREWWEVPFNEAVVLNPLVRLERGKRYQCFDMIAVFPHRAWPMRLKNWSFLAAILDSSMATP